VNIFKVDLNLILIKTGLLLFIVGIKDKELLVFLQGVADSWLRARPDATHDIYHIYMPERSME